MTGKELKHVRVEYASRLGAVFEQFAVDDETLRKARLWRSEQRKRPSAGQFADWLRNNGARRDRADGPAAAVTHEDGSRTEEWFSNGERDRPVGPAFVAKDADGTRYEAWYTKGYFIKGETSGSDPWDIAGVSFYLSAPSGP